jgi:hypothetical protein
MRTLSRWRPRCAAHDLLTEPLVEEPVVVEAGQRVAVSERASILVEAGVLERHRSLVRHRPRQLEPLVIPADRRLGEQLDQPDGLTLRDEREHDQDPVAIPAQQVDLGVIRRRVVGVDDDGLLSLECTERLRERGDVEGRLELLEPLRRPVTEREDEPARPVPVRDRALVDVHRIAHVACDEVRDLPRIQAPRQLAAHVEKAAQLTGKIAGPGQESSGLEGRRRLVGEDQEEPQIIVGELVMSELRESDDADRDIVVPHRDDDHRLVDVVRAGDRPTTGVGVRVPDEDRLAVLSDPAREPLADTTAQDGHVGRRVRADRA